jgi:acetylornithine deacetylase
MVADPISLLRKLVAIPSINPYSAELDEDERFGEARLAAFVADLLRDAGADVEVREAAPRRPNVIARIEGRHAGPPLLFVSHLDTVPVEGMTIEPFAGEVRDGRLYGRGSCDTKASMAAMLAALLRVAREGPPPRPVLYVATADEENGFRGMKAFLADGVGAHAAFVGEPTQLDIIIAHRGFVRWSIATHGKSAHSATPDEGVNAIYRMAPLIAELETLAAQLQKREPHPRLGPPTLSVGTVHGGHSVNTVPDRCVIEVDRRLIPGESAEVAEAAVRDLAERAGATIEPIFDAAPLEMPEDSDVVRRATAAVQAVTGTANVVGARYATEASRLAAAGIPVVVLGPGDAAQAHSEDEWVALDQVRAAAEVYHRLMTAE